MGEVFGKWRVAIVSGAIGWVLALGTVRFLVGCS